MPVLKPSGYRKDTALFYKESLFDSNAAPVVAFGTDEGNRIEYDGASSEEEFNTRFPMLKAEAMKNLQAIEPEIQVQDADGARIAFVMENEYASEKILDGPFMKKVAAAIGADSLMVGIPFKGTLIATDSNAPIRLKFPAIIAKYYNNPEQEPISDKVFLVENGAIVAMAGESIEDGPQQFTITEKGDTANYEVHVQAHSIPELTQSVNTSYSQVMSMIMQRKMFGGELAYHIGNAIPLDEALVDKCNSYSKQVSENEMAQTLVRALTQNGLRMSFYYNGNKIAPVAAEASNTGGAPDYTNLSAEELDDEFYKTLAIPNARTNMTALMNMTALQREYKNRDVPMPDPRKPRRTSDKKWWQFWK